MIIEFKQYKRFLRVYNNDTFPSIIFYISITVDAVIIFIIHYSYSILLYDFMVWIK